MLIPVPADWPFPVSKSGFPPRPPYVPLPDEPAPF